MNELANNVDTIVDKSHLVRVPHGARLRSMPSIHAYRRSWTSRGQFTFRCGGADHLHHVITRNGPIVPRSPRFSFAPDARHILERI
jgi:hypothetical protein